MRPLEIILLCTDAFLIILVYFRHRSRSITLASSLLAVLVVVAHVLIESYRWQMIVAYTLTGLLILVSIFRSRSLLHGHRLWLKSLFVTAAVLSLAVAIAIPVLLPVPKLPVPTGPFPVGTTSLHIIDHDRQEIYGEDPEGPRELMLQLWYPAASGQQKESAPYLENLTVAASAISDRLGLPSFFLGHISLVKNHAVAEARIDSTAAPFPLILFSHGLRGLRVQNTALFQELASHGYIVASVDHTYDSIITILPARRAFFFHSQSVFPEGEARTEAAEQLLEVRTQDLETVVAFLQQKSNEPASVFYNGLDFNKIGVIGHSTGGGTAIQYCAESQDCRAVVAFDSWLEPVKPGILQRSLKQPSMFMNTPTWLSAENQARGEDFFNLQEPPSYNVAITGTNHFDFTDVPLLTPVAHQIGLAGSIDGSRSVLIVNGLTLNFLNQHLAEASDQTFQDYASNFPEVIFESS